MQFNEYQDVIENIDWPLLQKQKKTLEKLLTKLSFHPISNENINDLWGLIELIENLQDVRENKTNNIVHFQKMWKT